MTDFETFYAMYPRKESRGDAIKAWGQVTKQYDPAEIIAGLEKQLPILRGQERKYTKLPATWLRKWCWMDEMEDPGGRVYTEKHRRPFGTWSEDEIAESGVFLRRVGAELFLRSGYTQEHLDGLQAARAPLKVVGHD